jgi:putative FmdB family regulatory protein
MPLYEYECQQCHRRVEKIQKFSDAPLTTCPHCAGTLERTLTAPAIQFKGSGWYKDLYSSAKPAASNSGESTGSKDSGTPASGDAKPAAAAAAPASSPAPSSPSTGSSGS